MINVFILIFLLLGVASAHEYYISRQQAKIVPNRIEIGIADEAGEVELFPPKENRVRRGALLAKVNADALALEEEEIRQQVRQNNLDSETTLLQLKRQKEELEFIAGLPSEKRIFIGKKIDTPIDQRAIKLLNEKIRLLQDRTKLANEKILTIFHKKKALKTICMPFDGRVQYQVSLPEHKEEKVFVQASTPIVTAVDDSAFFIVVGITDPGLAKLDPTLLSVHLELGGGENLHAIWDHKKIEKSGQEEVLVYFFKVGNNDSDKAWGLLGSNTVVRLCYRGDDTCLYEAKFTLAREAKNVPFETWEKLVEILRPGYCIVFVGETHLCLRKKQVP